jgi:hypothetical protein
VRPSAVLALNEKVRIQEYMSNHLYIVLTALRIAVIFLSTVPRAKDFSRIYSGVSRSILENRAEAGKLFLQKVI